MFTVQEMSRVIGGFHVMGNLFIHARIPVLRQLCTVFRATSFENFVKS